MGQPYQVLTAAHALQEGQFNFSYQRFSSAAGGQLSSFMPKVSPREAKTSLISFKDLRPRFGVLSNSFSVR
jgi:hypothetical protein